MAVIEKKVLVEASPGLIGVKCSGRNEKSALAARREGLLENVDGHVRPTPRGRRFLNRLLGRFLGEPGS